MRRQCCITYINMWHTYTHSIFRIPHKLIQNERASETSKGAFSVTYQTFHSLRYQTSLQWRKQRHVYKIPHVMFPLDYHLHYKSISKSLNDNNSFYNSFVILCLHSSHSIPLHLPQIKANEESWKMGFKRKNLLKTWN